MLPETICLFPLPNVVLFPDVFLPLHIFEPRYREMTRAALDGNRLIGMVLAKSASETEECYPIGCAGVVTHVEELDGGRYNIILRGLQKFRIVGEDETSSEPYRIARIDGIPEGPFDKADLKRQRERLEAFEPESFRITYSVLEGPLPVKNILTSMHLRPITDTFGTLAEWSSEFTTAPGKEEEGVQFMTRVFGAGFRSLKRHLGV